MTLTDRLVAEYTKEGATTRRMLERVPDDKVSWRPHPNSMSLGQLALHIATLPAAITHLVDAPVREMPAVPLPEAKNRDEVLATHDEGMQAALAKLAEWGDEGLDAQWRLVRNGATLIEQPRFEAVRALMFNHVFHHRGQLTVYYRLVGVPVPWIYGPTADEGR